ncbi:MAG: hypothetical protein INR71_03950, partial [Terriglobus roseus]|nr:hypothetical protein [Terriglobus roseus]
MPQALQTASEGTLTQGTLSPLTIPAADNHDRTTKDGPSAQPQDVQLPGADEASQLASSDSGKPAGETGHHSKTVKLPPQEVQETHLKEVERAQEDERRRERKEDEALHHSATVNGAELASSPSSTVGAHSTFTPKALNHSPDTSPDVETRAGRMVDTTSASSDDSTFRDPRANSLKSQLDAARPAGHASSPEAQLRLEEEEAQRVARERDSQTRHMPPKDSELTQDAQEFVQTSKSADKETVEIEQDSKRDEAEVAKAA